MSLGVNTVVERPKAGGSTSDGQEPFGVFDAGGLSVASGLNAQSKPFLDYFEQLLWSFPQAVQTAFSKLLEVSVDNLAYPYSHALRYHELYGMNDTTLGVVAALSEPFATLPIEAVFQHFGVSKSPSYSNDQNGVCLLIADFYKEKFDLLGVGKALRSALLPDFEALAESIFQGRGGYQRDRARELHAIAGHGWTPVRPNDWREPSSYAPSELSNRLFVGYLTEASTRDPLAFQLTVARLYSSAQAVCAGVRPSMPFGYLIAGSYSLAKLFEMRNAKGPVTVSAEMDATVITTVRTAAYGILIQVGRHIDNT